MTSRCLLMYLLLGSILTIKALDNEESRAVILELKQMYQLMSDEISMIKRKIWLDVFVKLNEMEEKLDATKKKTEPTVDQCSCSNVTAQVEGGKYNRKYDSLYKAFSEEKKISRQTLGQVKELQQNVLMFDKKIDQVEDVLKLTEGLKTGTADLLDRLSQSVSDIIEEQNVQKKLSSFRQPSFISDWILMKAQDAQRSHVSMEHGLQNIPYKVEVQIRPVDGVNSDWLFHGDSIFQSDDDHSIPYGGVVYLYNDKTVHLIAPRKANNGDDGAIINTGASGAFRLGSHHQLAKDAYARVKVWGPADFPKPDFQTSWKPLNIKDSKLSFYEVDHGLGDYPAFVNFQMRCKVGTSFLISEGVGASAEGGVWKTSGGVIWAFNDRAVRVWTAFMPPSWKGDTLEYSYLLLGAPDGWNFDNRCDNYNGEFRILAWSKNSAVVDRNYFTGSPIFGVLSETSFSPKSDLFSFHVQCEEGHNKGFRFKGYGNSQTVSTPFGGAVYAFNQSGEVRVWRPNPEKGGFLVHVHGPYGNGRNVQATNNASNVVEVLKGFR